MPTDSRVRLLRALRPWLCLVAGLAAADAQAARGNDPDTLRQNTEQLERVRSRISALNQSIEADRARRDQLAAALEDSEKSIASAQDEVHKLADQVDAQAVKTRSAQSQVADAQKTLDRQRAALAAQIRAAFLIGGNGRAALVLGETDPSRISRLLGYYDVLNHARLSRIDALQQQMRTLNDLQKGYQDQLKSLQSLQDQRRSAFTRLELRRGQRQKAIAEIDDRLQGESNELKQQQQNEKQVRDLIESLKKALAEAPPVPSDGRPFPQQKGRLGWPLRGPILADYGSAKGEGHLQWKGLWIGAPAGTAVRAAAAGRVAYVGWMSRYGLIVVVEHGGGYFTLYGHTANVTATAGDAVEAGQVIATAGDTGGYDQTGVYFEIRKGTDPQDPKQWLAKGGG